MDRAATPEAARGVGGGAGRDDLRIPGSPREAGGGGGRGLRRDLRNGYAQTSVPPYAVRARPGAPVATPIEWDELPGMESRRYTVRNVLRRLAQKSDPWADSGGRVTAFPDARAELDRLVEEETE